MFNSNQLEDFAEIEFTYAVRAVVTSSFEKDLKKAEKSICI